MQDKRMPVVATLVLVALIGAQMPVFAGTPRGPARLEGLLVGLDGGAASGYAVHLIDSRGEAVARADTTQAGQYSFKEVVPGEYAMGIETPDGLMAPVAAPPVRLAGGELARRDVRLMGGTPDRVQATTTANYSLGIWWAGLSKPAKAWTIVGALVFIGVTAAALDDDDDDDASPSGQ